MPDDQTAEPRRLPDCFPDCREHELLPPDVAARRRGCTKCRIRAMNARTTERVRRCWSYRLVTYARCNRLRRGAIHPRTDIDEAYLIELYQRQRGRCWWTGIDLCLDETGRPWSVSLDRIRNDDGYLRGNVVLSCSAANYGRQRATPEEMRSFVRKVRRAP